MTEKENEMKLDRLSRAELGNTRGGLPYEKPQLIVFRAIGGKVTCKDGQTCNTGNSTCNTGYLCNSGDIIPEQ